MPKIWTLKKISTKEMHAMVKLGHLGGGPWPLLTRFIKLHPKGNFILVATDYFYKWMEVEPLASMTQEVVIKFIKQNIIYKFDIPKSITIDQRTMFTGDKVNSFTQQVGIKLTNSTPYYAPTNGQAKAKNKILIDIIKKNL